MQCRMMGWKYRMGIKPRPKIEYFKLHKLAKQMHKEMFKAIAKYVPLFLLQPSLTFFFPNTLTAATNPPSA